MRSETDKTHENTYLLGTKSYKRQHVKLYLCNNGMVWYTRDLRPTRHSIGHFGDGALSSDVHLSFSNGGPAT